MATADRPANADLREKLQDWLPKLVLSPSLAAVLIFVYGFIAYTGVLSFTDSKMLASYDFIGFENYAKLFALTNWKTALVNLAIFATLFFLVTGRDGTGDERS